MSEQEPMDHALGRSRGGFTSKIHLLSDSNSLPLAAVLSSGAAHDSAFFHPVLKQVKIPIKAGRARTRPQEVVADKAYDAYYIRKALRKRGIKAMIPEKGLRAGTKRRKKGPHYRFCKVVYSKRASVEQSIGWLKENRRIATRYEKLAVSFLAMVKLAFIKFYLNKYSSDTA